jgi:hypothetical protein
MQGNFMSAALSPTVHRFLLLLLMAAVCAGTLQARQVSLNEIMASNNTTLADDDGDYEDWVEIYNHGNDPVNLHNFGLTDDYDNPFRWIFPDTTLYPGDYLLIWASNKDRAIPGNELHTNFAISSSGEEVLLTHTDGTRLDEIPPTEIPSDISYGRQPDGTGEWFYFDQPTPGEPNTTPPVSGLLDPPVVSHQPGFYTEPFDLAISHHDDEVSLYYTLDGSEPTTDSTPYSGPVSITNRTLEPNSLSTIPTNFITGRYGFSEPDQRIPKGTVVRVLAEKPGYPPARSKQSYFVYPDGESTHTLPVISIATDSLNLFGFDEGIYVPGTHYQEDRDDTGNYFQRGRGWEREASMEFFDENGELQFAQNVGIRIHGGYTRRYVQKSLRVYARSDYGESRINYPIFPDQNYDSYNRLILRNSGNDQGMTMFRDATAHELVRHLKFDTQAYRPSVVYINGEYWGIHNIRERYDRHYLERVYGVDPDNIDILSNNHDIQEGFSGHYRSLREFVADNDMADDTNLEEVKTRADLDNLLDYYSAQVYFVNTDWPHNNIDYWRLRIPYSPAAPEGHDGRWRWLFYDIDYTFGLVQPPSYDMLGWVANETGFNDEEWPNTLFHNLLKNESFKHDFINRMADHLNTSFLPEHVTSVMDNLAAVIEPEMPNYINRWPHPTHFNQWGGFINDMKSFAEQRPAFLRQNIVNYFGLSSQEPITIDVNDAALGSVKINTTKITPETPGIDEDPYPWDGIYFSGVPVTLQPEPERFHSLEYWLIDGERVDQQVLTVMPETVHEVVAVFGDLHFEAITPHTLDTTYYFHEWDDDEPAGTYPSSMGFVFMNEDDPGLTANVAGMAFGAYDHSSRTRINGQGEDGFSFINTSNPEGNPGYPGRRLGGAVLALDTRDVATATVGFEAGTVRANSRAYNLRLQYRIGSEGEFTDLLDEEGNPVEYHRNEEEGHSEFIGPVALPEQALGQPRVELLWRYYHTGQQLDPESGQRDMLNVSFIHVVGEQPGPDEYMLRNIPYEFTTWPSNALIGTAPPSMRFVYMNQTDPGLDARPLGYTSGAFDLESRTRIVGLDEDGVGFINTSNLDGNPGYPGRRLGGALLALNTEGQGSVEVEWTGGTVRANSRIYHLRLQYRVGSEGEFLDVRDASGNPMEYRRFEVNGHREELGPVLLPGDVDDQPRVELLWRYYYSGEREDEDSGQRSMLNLTNIRVNSQPLMGGQPGEPTEFRLYQNYPNPFYPHSTIRYDLPQDQHVRIDLYTITGQRVTTLFEGQAQAGRHSVPVDTSGLASGIYIYRFISDQYTDTGKLSVIK